MVNIEHLYRAKLLLADVIVLKKIDKRNVIISW